MCGGIGMGCHCSAAHMGECWVLNTVGNFPTVPVWMALLPSTPLSTHKVRLRTRRQRPARCSPPRSAMWHRHIVWSPSQATVDNECASTSKPLMYHCHWARPTPSGTVEIIEYGQRG